MDSRESVEGLLANFAAYGDQMPGHAARLRGWIYNSVLIPSEISPISFRWLSPKPIFLRLQLQDTSEESEQSSDRKVPRDTYLP